RRKGYTKPISDRRAPTSGPAIRMPALRWQLLSTAPRIITWPHTWEKRYFRDEILDLARVGHLMEVPGRGLEPLRISPPDPKSGASANSATPASLIYRYL